MALSLIILTYLTRKMLNIFKGPVMLIGVKALDLVPKKAAGTAAGLTGLLGYLGGALFANIAMGFVVDEWSWDGGFIVIIIACVLSIIFTAFTWNREKINLNLIRSAK